MTLTTQAPPLSPLKRPWIVSAHLNVVSDIQEFHLAFFLVLLYTHFKLKEILQALL